MTHMNSNVEVLAEYIANIIVQNKELTARVETLEAAISKIQTKLEYLKYDISGTTPHCLG